MHYQLPDDKVANPQGNSGLVVDEVLDDARKRAGERPIRPPKPPGEVEEPTK